MKKKKHLWLGLALIGMLFVLTACGTGDVTNSSTGVWDKYVVLNFAKAIKFLSFNNPGVGIILFTIVIRIILLPLMHYQQKSMRKTQELQPKLKELQEKYSAKDMETQNKLREEQQRLYADNNVNMYAGCLPLLVQLPIMMALYQAISRAGTVAGVAEGHFLWLDLAQKDPYFILPVLAAIFTFISSKLTSMTQIENNATNTVMTIVMPLMIFWMGFSLPSGLSLYWVVSNAFQVGQTLLISNPFKIRKEREAAAKKARDLEKALKKAQNPKKKKGKK